MPPKGPWRGSSRGAGRISTVSRLKPLSTDPLDDIGLPSKGETRLNDLRKQEDYFAQIRQRLASTTKTVSGDSLAQQLSGLSVSDHACQTPKKDIQWPILFAMRKLREAIVATRRADQFASDVLCFIVRSGISAHNVETYQPTLVLLLRTLHPKRPLSAEERAEFVIYHVLDLACRQGNFQEASRTLLDSKLGENETARVQQLLCALATGNWARFWRVHRRLTSMERVIAEYALENVRANAVSCLQKSYFSVEQTFVEKCLGEHWQETSKRCTTWQLDGTSVVIRKVKAR